jgi:polysaccharide export outer membrane protein
MKPAFKRSSEEKRFMHRIAIAIVVCGIPALAWAQQEAAYQVNPGDVLDVSVWGEENLQRQVLVLPDGMITFPLAGELEAAGRTTRELEATIAEQLERYIPDALVTVAVANAAGNKIYVLGEVNRPGEYPITRPLDVMQALTLAGGLTAYASQNKIKVLRREGTDEEQVVYPFRYGDVKDGDSMETNIRLRAGDVIIVPGTTLF